MDPGGLHFGVKYYLHPNVPPRGTCRRPRKEARRLIREHCSKHLKEQLLRYDARAVLVATRQLDGEQRGR